MNIVRDGWAGEKLAADHLRQKGYAILETNYRTPAGEVDIIARDGDYTVFVEVKSRRHLDYGYPREAVGPQKQRRIKKVALYYMAGQKTEINCRFDVVEVLEMDGTEITHIENAFW